MKQVQWEAGAVNHLRNFLVGGIGLRVLSCSSCIGELGSGSSRLLSDELLDTE